MNDEEAGNREPGARKKRRWIPIVIGVVLLFGVLAIGAVAFTALWFRENMTITQSSEEAATQQFEEVRRRFAGQEPLIQLVDGRPQITRELSELAVPRAPLSAIHVIAYDRDEGNTVSFSLPFWLLRMKSGPIRISAYQQGWDDRGVAFRVEEIERHGPGIVVDVSEPGEGRVLIWAE